MFILRGESLETPVSPLRAFRTPWKMAHSLLASPWVVEGRRPWVVGVVGVGKCAPRGGPGLLVTLCRSPQRSPSACGSAAAAWRSSPAAAWDMCSGSSTPTPSQVAAAPSLPGKWLGGCRSVMTRSSCGDDSNVMLSDRCWAQKVLWGTVHMRIVGDLAVVMESRPGWPGTWAGGCRG